MEPVPTLTEIARRIRSPKRATGFWKATFAMRLAKPFGSLEDTNLKTYQLLWAGPKDFEVHDNDGVALAKIPGMRSPDLIGRYRNQPHVIHSAHVHGLYPDWFTPSQLVARELASKNLRIELLEPIDMIEFRERQCWRLRYSHIRSSGTNSFSRYIDTESLFSTRVHVHPNVFECEVSSLTRVEDRSSLNLEFEDLELDSTPEYPYRVGDLDF